MPKKDATVVSGPETPPDSQTPSDPTLTPPAEGPPEPSPEPAPEPSPEDKELADAQKAHADATAAHAETKAKVDEARANLDAVIASREEKPVYGKHIFVSFGGGAPVLRDAPKDWDKEKPRTLRVDGVNVEHVGEVPGEDADGNKGDIWVYRQM